MLNSQLSLMLEQNKKYAHCLKVCVYVAYGGDNKTRTCDLLHVKQAL